MEVIASVTVVIMAANLVAHRGSEEDAPRTVAGVNGKPRVAPERDSFTGARNITEPPPQIGGVQDLPGDPCMKDRRDSAVCGFSPPKERTQPGSREKSCS
ncbi:unnamed protein product [Pleuronectes platessa]|uniref:Uncharacterized protein n=1 Tax=Pleuronectes platessa TaxID=8262 RepID=A0A9N7Z5B3_PLEPL|nr:unnamed protein product [Pleuronectes platessa]